MNSDKKRCGFTLVELLVVISIIALLLSILVPTLSKAREQAKRVICRSNLQQLGVYCVLYQINNDGWTLPGYNQPPGWPVLIEDEFKLNSGGQQIGHVPDFLFCSSIARKEISTYSGGYGYNWSNSGEEGIQRRKIINVARPSEKIVVADATLIWPRTMIFLYSSERDIDWFRHASKKPYKFPDFPRRNNWTEGVFDKYGEGNFNVLWLDGHVTKESHNTVPMQEQFRHYWLF